MSIEKSFNKVISSKNPDKINDFLVEISKTPHKEYLGFIDILIKKLDPHIFEAIKLNLIYLIGEIGSLIPLEEKYTKILMSAYYSSDRWIRNEIMQALRKIIDYVKVEDDVIKLIGYATNDEYLPIKVNALKILLNLDENPLYVRRNLFLALNSKNLEIEKLCVKIFEKFILDFNELFDSLDYSDNYLILKPKAIRALLILYFQTLIDLESFKKKILTSKWEDNNKEKYLKEIDTYEKILMRRL